MIFAAVFWVILRIHFHMAAKTCGLGGLPVCQLNARLLPFSGYPCNRHKSHHWLITWQKNMCHSVQCSALWGNRYR